MIKLRFVIRSNDTATPEVIDFPGTVIYQPIAPQLEVQYKTGRQGRYPLKHRVPNVEESLQIVLDCNAVDWLRTFQRVFHQALFYAEEDRPDAYVAIEVQEPDRHTDWFEAQLYNGVVVLGNPTGFVLILEWERSAYWRGVEKEVSLYNPSLGAIENASTTVEVQNRSDENAYNWATIESEILGDAPAETIIRLTNSFPTNRLRKIWVGWSDRPLITTYEGESGGTFRFNSFITPPTNTPDASASSGEKGSATGFLWEIPDTTETDYKGLFRVLINGSLPTNTKWQVGAGYNIVKYQTNRQVFGRNGWTDAGVIALPPRHYLAQELDKIGLWVETDGVSEGTIDYILLLPLAQSRLLDFIGFNAVPLGIIEDDGTRGYTRYKYEALSDPVLNSYGEQIMLVPSSMLPPPQRQQLTFAFESDLQKAEALRSADLKVSVRERWGILP